MRRTAHPVFARRAATGPEDTTFEILTDAANALTIFVVLQFAIPSSLRLPALGGVGYPAAFWAIILGGWWCWERFRRGLLHPLPFNPVRIAVGIFLAAVLLSYVIAMTRPLTGIESSQADLGLLRMLIGCGLLLLATDGLNSWPRFVTLLRRISVVGAAFAALGLLQFFTGRSWVDWISIPGFVAASDSGLAQRSGFTRAIGTAIHPLEFAAALSMVLPISIAFGLYDKSRSLISRWWAPGVISFSLALSGSRSAYLGLVLGLIVMAVRCSPAVRLRLLVAGIAMATVIFVTVPGMIGTIRGMFLFIDDDPSAESRTDSYSMVGEFFEHAPFFGRGIGTFLPVYRILDNQVLLMVIEVGMVGLVAFILLLASAACGSWMSTGRAPNPLIRELGPAIAASLVAGTSLMMFFDFFGFPIAFGVMFLVIGLGGAYWNLSWNLDPIGNSPAPRG